MKILVLSDVYYPDNPGGSQEVARRLAQGFYELGHEVEIVTTRDPSLPEVREYEGLAVHSLPLPFGLQYLPGAFSSSETTQKILQVFEGFNPDMIHAHNTHSALGWGWIEEAKKKKISICCTFHDHLSVTQGKLVPAEATQPDDVLIQSFWKECWRYRRATRWSRRKKIRKVLEQVDLLTAVSSDLARRLKDNGLPAMKVILNGIDLEEKLDTAWPDRPTLLFLGRPTAEKGQQVLLKALEKSSPDWKLVFAGNLSEKQKKAIVSLAPSVDIEFTGWLNPSEKKRKIDQSWAVVTLSIYPDPCPLTNYESIARARPVLGTLWGGTAEVVRDGKEAWLVDPRNIHSVAEAMDDMLKHPEEVRQRGQRGYRRAWEIFQWKDIIPQYLACFDRLVSR
jgi:glycosyltransferase involved in cell wall biosynthesis